MVEIKRELLNSTPLHDRYIKRFDFPVSKLFHKIKSQLVEEYVMMRSNGMLGPQAGFYSYPISIEPELCMNVYQNFSNIVEETFYVNRAFDSERFANDFKLYCVCQNNDMRASVSHNHTQTTSIASVFYLDLPEEGGELDFYFGDTSARLKPKLNTLYVFPHWVYHKPQPQKDSKYRICINMEFSSYDRPIVKETGDIW